MIDLLVGGCDLSRGDCMCSNTSWILWDLWPGLARHRPVTGCSACTNPDSPYFPRCKTARRLFCNVHHCRPMNSQSVSANCFSVFAIEMNTVCFQVDSSMKEMYVPASRAEGWQRTLKKGRTNGWYFLQTESIISFRVAWYYLRNSIFHLQCQNDGEVYSIRCIL